MTIVRNNGEMVPVFLTDENLRQLNETGECIIAELKTGDTILRDVVLQSPLVRLGYRHE